MGKDHGSPRRGRQNTREDMDAGRLCRPLRGLAFFSLRVPRADARGYMLPPFGLQIHLVSTPFETGSYGLLRK